MKARRQARGWSVFRGTGDLDHTMEPAWPSPTCSFSFDTALSPVCPVTFHSGGAADRAWDHSAASVPSVVFKILSKLYIHGEDIHIRLARGGDTGQFSIIFNF